MVLLTFLLFSSFLSLHFLTLLHTAPENAFVPAVSTTPTSYTTCNIKSTLIALTTPITLFQQPQPSLSPQLPVLKGVTTAVAGTHFAEAAQHSGVRTVYKRYMIRMGERVRC